MTNRNNYGRGNGSESQRMSIQEYLTRRNALKTGGAVIGGSLLSSGSVSAAEKTPGVELWGGGGSIDKLSTEDGSVIQSINEEERWDLAVDPVSDLLYHGVDDTIKAYDPYKEEYVWQTTPSGVSQSGSGVYYYDAITDDGGRVYFCDESEVFILDSATGQELGGISAWFQAPVQDMDYDPVNDYLYVASEDSGHYCYEDGGEGAEVWSKTGDSGMGIAADNASGVVYCGTKAGEVVARDKLDGTEIWRQSYQGGSDPGVTAIGVKDDDSMIFAGSEGDPLTGKVDAIDSGSGSVIWTESRGYFAYGDILIDPEREVIYPAYRDGSMIARNMSDGSAVWNAGTNYDTAAIRTVEPGETGPNSIFALWQNYKAIVAMIVGLYALIGAWSRSLTLAAWAGYTAFLIIAFATETDIFVNIALVTLVLVVVGFAFKFTRSEVTGGVD